MSKADGTYWIVGTSDDGRRCRVFLRHGKTLDGYFMAEYRGYFNYRRNEIKLYRSRFSANGCPKEDTVSLFEVRTEPRRQKAPEAAKPAVPEKLIRHRPAECPGQVAIDFD